MFPDIPLNPAGEAMKKSILSIPWTNEPLLDDTPEGLSSAKIEFLHDLALSGHKRAVPEIRKYLARFPAYSTLLNYLRVAYQINRQHRQAAEILKQLVAIHPDYLFTRIGLALEALDSQQTEKAAAALGPEFDIRSIYPNRAQFHRSEMRNFYMVVGIIHARRGDSDLALGVKAALDEIDPQPEVQDTLIREAMLANLKSIKDKTAADAKRRISVKTAPLPTKIVATASPVFHHKEIHDLYEYGDDLPMKMIRKLLSLPRPTLVEDLIGVLEDCIIRTPNFMNQQVEQDLWLAPLHALNLLAELKATEALQSVLRFLSIHPDALDFWWGLEDHSPQISRIIADDIPRCTEWLKSPAIERRAKGILTESMEHLARTDPQRMDEIVDSMQEVLAFLLDCPPSANILDTGFLSLLVCGIIELRAKRLLPLIKTAYRKNLIEEYMVGSLDSVIADISASPGNAPETFSIEACYHRFQDRREVPPHPPAPLTLMPDFRPPDWSQQATSETVSEVAGRNDPCPCGSGRKYKKCCMR